MIQQMNDNQIKMINMLITSVEEIQAKDKIRDFYNSLSSEDQKAVLIDGESSIDDFLTDIKIIWRFFQT